MPSLFKTVIFSLCCLFSFLSGEQHSIVFIHIGDQIPDYAHTAISQAASFNPDCPIYMLANQEELDKFHDPIALPIPLETLEITDIHSTFLKDCPHKKRLSLFSLERFFYLEEFMRQFDLHNVFHLEYDNMLYANLGNLLPIFQAFYPKAAIPFDNDTRAIPGFVYIANPEAMTEMADFISKNASNGLYDMFMLGLYKNVTNKEGVDHLPIILQTYTLEKKLGSKMGHKAKKPTDYYKNIEHFDSIFDAAAIGQYLGGIDPKNGTSKPGFINESCVFNPSKLTFVWEEDDLGRKVPFAIYKNEKRRINNLHIHCKDLKKFAS